MSVELLLLLVLAIAANVFLLTAIAITRARGDAPPPPVRPVSGPRREREAAAPPGSVDASSPGGEKPPGPRATATPVPPTSPTMTPGSDARLEPPERAAPPLASPAAGAPVPNPASPGATPAPAVAEHPKTPRATRTAPARTGSTAGTRAGAGGEPGESSTGSTAARGGRRPRFVLPPLETDHERTERAVLSLLGDGAGGAPTGRPPASGGGSSAGRERLVGSPEDDDAGRRGTVVALGLTGLDEVEAGSGRDAADRLITPVMDALRRSARPTDRVASVGRGHFRVFLVDADEAAAARFVGRVRGVADRRLGLAPCPVRLAAGWAEVEHAGRLEQAVRTAEERRRHDVGASHEQAPGKSSA